MCGIVGLFDLNGTRRPDPARLERLNDAQSHRGPDGAGRMIAPGVGLAHRRLAIIDLAGGDQPISNEDGTAWLVFNGEIYNFLELRQELVDLGHRFKTRSDSEVILHAWESWGRECVSRLSGMFAFAIWDEKARGLFLARDRLGMKPLYYTRHADGWLGFASELGGIVAADEMTRPWSIQALESYCALGYVPDPLTIHPDVHKLPPAHHLWVPRGGTRVAEPSCYWRPRFEVEQPPRDLDAAAGELRERLAAAVKSHLIADVPVATFLSGGLDSSAVAALMARYTPDPPEACTVSFADRDHDESHHAALVATRHGLRHHVERADPERFDLLESLARHYGEPFGDPSALPTWLVCGMARQHAKVVLSGDGGDENLAGYSRHRALLAEERLRGTVPETLRRILFGWPGRWYPKLDRAPRWLRARNTLRSLGGNWIDAALQAVEIMPIEIRQGLYTDRARRELQGFETREIWRAYATDAPEHPLSRLQALDLKGFLAGRVLVKVDRASMAHGLEVRAPLLDYQLVEWLAGLPPDWKLHKGIGKYLLKQAMQPVLPEEILWRPKQGFNLPLAAWTRGPLAGRLRDPAFVKTLAATGWFEPGAVTRMIDRHLAGGRDFSAALWALWMLAASARQAGMR
ncbi:Asparagine synthetase [glutamine-hydrolyzing] 1 [Candidatus Magnetaquicoccaceae bacterium FCR-1]|uniref:asparagine synthase (glutamine-hydrolyzing) n=1 Tax=Candidatus Magnetaquiglobus chichijimensis TaxID=3141448 RepID=A0ABQ0C4B7_9PROT